MVDVGLGGRCDIRMLGIVEGLRKFRAALFDWVGPKSVPLPPEVAQRGAAKSSSGGALGVSSGADALSAPRLNYNPRRYKRALLMTGTAGIQHDIASASAQFRGRPFAVVDLSHTGVAIERGGIIEADLPDPAKPEPIVLNLGVLEPFSAQVTLARHSDRVIAFEFVDVSTDGRLTIDRFLDPKMIGLNMRAVDRSFFSPGETFSLWYCGPRDTNFFLWMNSGSLDRAIIQLGDEQFTLAPSAGPSRAVRFVRHSAVSTGKSNGESNLELRDSVLFALDVALQVKEGGDAMSGLVKLLTESADTLHAGV